MADLHRTGALIERIAIVFSLVAFGVAVGIALSLAMLSPAHAQTAAACNPGDANARPTTPPYVHSKVYYRTGPLRAEGLGLWWYCWNGTRWTAPSVTLHVQDAQAQIAQFTARVTQWHTAPDQAARAALTAQWWAETSPNFCASQIANAGYAGWLCSAVSADAVAGLPTDQPVPPPPAEVWTVAPNPSSTSTPPSRPTFAWLSGVRASTASAERVAVGAACDPKVGRVESGGAYFGVLGRADRVALCRRQ